MTSATTRATTRSPGPAARAGQGGLFRGRRAEATMLDGPKGFMAVPAPAAAAAQARWAQSAHRCARGRRFRPTGRPLWARNRPRRAPLPQPQTAESWQGGAQTRPGAARPPRRGAHSRSRLRPTTWGSSSAARRSTAGAAAGRAGDAPALVDAVPARSGHAERLDSALLPRPAAPRRCLVSPFVSVCVYSCASSARLLHRLAASVGDRAATRLGFGVVKDHSRSRHSRPQRLECVVVVAL